MAAALLAMQSIVREFPAIDGARLSRPYSTRLTRATEDPFPASLNKILVRGILLHSAQHVALSTANDVTGKT